MADENADDTYIIEDTGGAIEEIEREMRETAEEAVSDDPESGATGSQPVEPRAESPRSRTDRRRRHASHRSTEPP